MNAGFIDIIEINELYLIPFSPTLDTLERVNNSEITSYKKKLHNCL